MKILEYILSMENYIFPESFGPEFLLGVLKNTILEPYPELANAQYQGAARDLLSYATYGAQTQWEIAANAVAMAKGDGTKVPESDESICYICGEPINNQLLGKANADHLLPSALGFLFFGLPGNLNTTDLSGMGEQLKTEILNTSRLLSQYQFHNYAWCHQICNIAKSAKSFVNVLALGKGCSDTSTSCDIKLVTPAYNVDVIQAFTVRMAAELQRTQGFTITSDTLDQNIVTTFTPVVNSLTYAFNLKHTSYPDFNLLQYYTFFNMYVFIIVFCLKLGKGVPPTALENIQKVLHFTQHGGGESTIQDFRTKFGLKLIPQKEFEGCLAGIEIKKKEDESKLNNSSQTTGMEQENSFPSTGVSKLKNSSQTTGMEEENSFPSTGVSQIKNSFLVPGSTNYGMSDGAARKHRRKTKNRKRKHKRKTRRRS